MKVYPFKIPKLPNENILLQVDVSERFYDRLHQHEEVQLSYVHQGSGTLIVGNGVTTFKSGDFVAIDSNVPHVFLSQENSEPSRMSSLFFSKNAFGENFFDNQEMLVLESLWTELSFGLKLSHDNGLLKNLFSELNNDNKFGLFINLLLLLEHLKNSKKTRIMNADRVMTKISLDHGERLQKVFDFVMRHYSTDVQLEQVAEIVPMTKNAFCRFFKQRTNKTFFQFLTEIRMQHARHLLIERQELPIATVAILSGYPTISNFNRQFKESNKVTPKVFRKMRKQMI